MRVGSTSIVHENSLLFRGVGEKDEAGKKGYEVQGLVG